MGLIPVTVCTPTIPPRTNLLGRAIESVHTQTVRPAAHIVSVDHNRNGGAATLDSAIHAADTEWVATLDDDDEWLPNHLETLWALVQESNFKADLAFTHFMYSSSGDGGHLERFRGVPFDVNNPRQITNVFMVRKSLWQQVGGFSGGFDPDSFVVDSENNRIGYDFNFVKKCSAAQATFVNSDLVTWIYHVGHGSTLGMRDRW
jgi:glycosyltransferase involved in cell wall biosynthesis